MEGMWRPDDWTVQQRVDVLLHQGPVTIVPKEIDFSGRIVADVLVNNHNLADLLGPATGNQIP
jgi:hypothetical protein